MVAFTGTMKRALASAYRLVLAEYLPNQNPRHSIRTIRANRHEQHNFANSAWNKHCGFDWGRCFHSTSSSRTAAASSSAVTSFDHFMEDTELEDNSVKQERMRDANDQNALDADENNLVSNLDAFDSSRNRSTEDQAQDDNDEDDMDSRPYERDSTKLDEWAAQLPRIVDEILTFHDEIGNKKLRESFQKLVLREHQKLAILSKSRDKTPPRTQPVANPDSFDEDRELGEALGACGTIKNPWDFYDEKSNFSIAHGMVQPSEKVEKYPWDDLGTLNTTAATDSTSQWKAVGTGQQWPSLLTAQSPKKALWDSVGNSDPNSATSREISLGSIDEKGRPGLCAGEFTDNLVRENKISTGDVNCRAHSVEEACYDEQVLDTDTQLDVPYYKETEAEKRRQVLFAEAIVLLRILSDTDWEVFDRPLSRNEDDQETYLDDTADILNPVSNTETAKPENDEDVTHERTNGVDKGKILLDQLSNLLTEANLGREPLLTADYNLLLVRMAISPELLPDEILDFMLQTYDQMIRLSESGFEECTPNAETNEIILLALCRRFSAYKTAAQIISQLLMTDAFACEPKTLKAALFLCEKQGEHEMARQILSALKKHKSSKIPRSVFVSFLEIMKMSDSRKEAIELLNFALERASRSEKQQLDKVFVTALKWPSQNSYGGAVDNRQMIDSILSLIESKTSNAGVLVWKTLTEQAAAGAREDSSRWTLVLRAVRGWLSRDYHDHRYNPDYWLLRHGLDACSALHNSELATTLISSRLQASTLTSSENSLLTESKKGYTVSFQYIVKALQICLIANDMHSCQRIMDEVRPLLLPAHKLRVLFLLNLKGYANRGDTASAQKIINEMKAYNMNLGDEVFGSFLYACAVEKNLSKAREIFRSLQGEQGNKPGPLCYEGYILACVRSQAWEDVISAFNTMKETKVEPSPSSYHGILLSIARSKGLSETKTFLRDVLVRNGSLNRVSSLLAVKLLIPEVGEGASSLSDLRDKFKLLGEAGEIPREKILSVMRSLRVAELEEQRKPSRGLQQDVITDRRKQAWTNFMEELLGYVDAQDDNR